MKTLNLAVLMVTAFVLTTCDLWQRRALEPLDAGPLPTEHAVAELGGSGSDSPDGGSRPSQGLAGVRHWL